MNLRTWMAFLCALGPIVTACYADRPLLVVTSDDGAAPGQAGSDGTGTGAAGSNGGAAGYAGGTAGVSAAGAGGGGAGTGGPVGNCDAKPIFMKYSCSIIGACHDAQGSAAGLDLATPGWENRLVGTLPNGGGAVATRSMCAGLGRPYLIAGSRPAAGLLLDKLRLPPPCGSQMPNIGGPMTASELACIQSWANALTAR